MMYLKRGDKVVGPLSDEKIRAGLQSGQLRKEDLASTSPSGPWKPLSGSLQSQPHAQTQASTIKDDREPSELWILLTDIWVAVKQRKKVAAPKPKSVESKKVRGDSDGLISPSLAYILIGALALSAFIYFPASWATKRGASGTAVNTAGGAISAGRWEKVVKGQDRSVVLDRLGEPMSKEPWADGERWFYTISGEKVAVSFSRAGAVTRKDEAYMFRPLGLTK